MGTSAPREDRDVPDNLRSSMSDLPAPRAGYLASVSDVVCNVRRLDDLEGDLVIEAERLAGDEARVLYFFKIFSKDFQILTGKAAVVLAA